MTLPVPPPNAPLADAALHIRDLAQAVDRMVANGSAVRLLKFGTTSSGVAYTTDANGYVVFPVPGLRVTGAVAMSWAGYGPYIYRWQQILEGEAQFQVYRMGRVGGAVSGAGLNPPAVAATTRMEVAVLVWGTLLVAPDDAAPAQQAAALPYPSPGVPVRDIQAAIKALAVAADTSLSFYTPAWVTTEALSVPPGASHVDLPVPQLSNIVAAVAQVNAWSNFVSNPKNIGNLAPLDVSHLVSGSMNGSWPVRVFDLVLTTPPTIARAVPFTVVAQGVARAGITVRRRSTARGTTPRGLPYPEMGDPLWDIPGQLADLAAAIQNLAEGAQPGIQTHTFVGTYAAARGGGWCDVPIPFRRCQGAIVQNMAGGAASAPYAITVYPRWLYSWQESMANNLMVSASYANADYVAYPAEGPAAVPNGTQVALVGICWGDDV